MDIKFNINNCVKVRLNDEGFRIHKEYVLAIWNSVANRQYALEQIAAYKPPAVDEEGYCKFQLWHLMQIFGPEVGLGCFSPFDTEIIFVTN